MRLGMKPTAWSNRRNRGSIPTEAIDRLLAEEKINPAFVYQGVGAPHAAQDEDAYRRLFAKRLAQVLSSQVRRAALTQMGYLDWELEAMTKGKAFPSIKALRDLCSVCHTLDLNWLVRGDLAQPAQPPKPRLKLLLDGKAVLVKPGDSGMTHQEMRSYLIKRHGSIKAAAQSRAWNYSALCAALNVPVAVKPSPHTLTHQYRLTLGLPTSRGGAA